MNKKHTNTTEDKKAFVKKLIEDKKQIHKFIREGKSLTELSKIRNIAFARPI